MYIYEYIWIDHIGNLRSKCKYSKTDDINCMYSDYKNIWNFDGSSTGQATGDNSEVYLKPVAHYNHPDVDGYLILCETVDYQNTPHSDNTRWRLANLFKDRHIEQEDPWFGFEVEFFMIDTTTNMPIGINNDKIPKQGQFYCSVGASNCFGREIMDELVTRCHTAGVNLVGTNAEVACGQWEYQIFGKGIQAADDVWMSKYILAKLCEKHNISICFNPKPFLECNGSGMHTNFSTERMRNKTTGEIELYRVIELLRANHKEHMSVYGIGNEQRMTGIHETACYEKFTWGYADRGASVRVPKTWINDRCGYIEDRRPASNADPYKVIISILTTCYVPAPVNRSPYEIAYGLYGLVSHTTV